MSYPPYMNSTGLISKIFTKISEAQKPDRFTTDFLANVIGTASGSARPIIPLLKRINFLQADSSPTSLYNRFRNPSERASAMLEALKVGYSDLYLRSEYAHLLPKDKLRDLVIEVTGLDRENQIVTGIVGTFLALKAVGQVTEETRVGSLQPSPPTEITHSISTSANGGEGWVKRGEQELGLNLAYTINLNLPVSTDPDVFNAIFRALKEHLLAK